MLCLSLDVGHHARSDGRIMESVAMIIWSPKLCSAGWFIANTGANHSVLFLITESLGVLGGFLLLQIPLVKGLTSSRSAVRGICWDALRGGSNGFLVVLIYYDFLLLLKIFSLSSWSSVWELLWCQSMSSWEHSMYLLPDKTDKGNPYFCIEEKFAELFGVYNSRPIWILYLSHSVQQ